MITALALGAVVAATPLDKWELKAPLAPKTKTTWVLTVDAKVGGLEHKAKFDFNLDVKDPAEGKPLEARAEWTNLEVDGNPMGQEMSWEVELAPNGTIAKGPDPDTVRSLSAMMLAYPSAAVGANDTWEATLAGGKTTLKGVVNGHEKLGDVDVLRATTVLSETGADAMKVDGVWWVDKEGKIRKFQLKVKNWIVPVAGPELIDATIKGELVTK